MRGSFRKHRLFGAAGRAQRRLCTSRVLENLTITSVRGEHTRTQLADAGIRTPLVVGDPALFSQALVHSWTDLRPAPVWPLCAVPHATDNDLAYASKAAGVRVVTITRPPDEVVRDLLRCRAVASSSLHGLVFADAFGVPSLAYQVNRTHYLAMRDRPKLADYFSALPDAPVGVPCLRRGVQWRTHAFSTESAGQPEHEACQGAFGNSAHDAGCGGGPPCKVSLLTLAEAAAMAARGDLPPRVTFAQRATMARAFVSSLGDALPRICTPT